MRWSAGFLCVVTFGCGAGVAAGAQPGPAPTPVSLTVPGLLSVDPATQALTDTISVNR